MQKSWGPVGHTTLMGWHQPPHNNFSVFIHTAQVRGWLGSEGGLCRQQSQAVSTQEEAAEKASFAHTDHRKALSPF